MSVRVRVGQKCCLADKEEERRKSEAKKKKKKKKLLLRDRVLMIPRGLFLID